MRIQLYIPDISGFSTFVNETEIEHGQQIIKSLMETIIDSNFLRMKIYEIEGDAIFFYCKNSSYTPALFCDNSKKILEDFRIQKGKLDEGRKCKCNACSGILKLTLKFIVHEDDIKEIKIKNYKKFYGIGLLKIHLLMKNDIPSNEYLLLTNEVLKRADTLDLKMLKEYSHKSTLFGNIETKYLCFDNA